MRIPMPFGRGVLVVGAPINRAARPMAGGAARHRGRPECRPRQPRRRRCDSRLYALATRLSAPALRLMLRNARHAARRFRPACPSARDFPRCPGRREVSSGCMPPASARPCPCCRCSTPCPAPCCSPPAPSPRRFWPKPACRRAPFTSSCRWTCPAGWRASSIIGALTWRWSWRARSGRTCSPPSMPAPFPACWSMPAFRPAPRATGRMRRGWRPAARRLPRHPRAIRRRMPQNFRALGGAR